MPSAKISGRYWSLPTNGLREPGDLGSAAAGDQQRVEQRVERILREGGTSSWVLDPTRASGCDYVVCTRSGIDWREGTEPQGSAFLVGRVSGVVRSPEAPDRHLIKMSEYALTNLPNVWQGWRNPVRYSTMEDLQIELAQLDFNPMPPRPNGGQPAAEAAASAFETDRPLTIEQAKAGLAVTFSVTPSQIEILIRG